MQSPDALLEGVVEQACQQRKYVSIQSRWLKLISNAEHAAVKTAQGSNHIQQSVMNMWQRGRTGQSCSTDNIAALYSACCDTVVKTFGHVWQFMAAHAECHSSCGNSFVAGSQQHVQICFLQSTHDIRLFAVAEDIPHLKAVVGTCHSAAAFAENAVADAVTEWWTQPAVHAAPWLKR